MKISIITILDNQNLGTYLQAFALTEVLKKMGHIPELIDYYRDSESLFSVFFSALKREDVSFFKKISSAIYRSVAVFIERNKLHSFLRSKCLLTQKKYKSFNELCSAPPVADIFLTGSDQVWNSVYNRGVDASFYLDFAPYGKKRVAYAASIGMDNFFENEECIISQLLKKYSAISVRETSAKFLIQKLGDFCVDVVLDPTFLFNKKDWKMIASEAEFKKTEPYILVYTVNDAQNPILESVTKKISHRLGYKIYQVSSDWFRSKLNSSDKYFSFASPQLFLKLILEADFVVVSSFHGTAFSVNLNKKFVSVVPDNFNSRVFSILKLLQLEDRIVYEANVSVDSLLSDINYEKVNSILQEKRELSLDFLSKNLNTYFD